MVSPIASRNCTAVLARFFKELRVAGSHIGKKRRSVVLPSSTCSQQVSRLFIFT
jgi:hypothetical protein